nr:uncharacterized protein LOC118879702 isoform X1 [Drosophila suzukii]
MLSYSEVVKMSKDELLELLSEKGIMFGTDATIYQLRAALNRARNLEANIEDAEDTEIQGQDEEQDSPSTPKLANRMLTLIEDRDKLQMADAVAPLLEPSGSSQQTVMNMSRQEQIEQNIRSMARETSEINQMMELYTARKKLAELKLIVAELEGMTTANASIHQVDLKDVEAMIPEFSGDDNLSVQVWIRELEKAAEVHKLSVTQCLSIGTRLLRGSAKQYMLYEKVSSCPEMSATLTQVFGNRMSNQEIAKQLQKRTIGKSETLMQYFITMRNIAQQGNFDEVDVVKYIVDGLEEHSGRAAPLYYCITLDELRQKLMRFQSVRLESNRKAVTMIPRPGAVIPKDTRCYNCRQMGHTAKDYKKPKRPDNGCFICFEVGHMHRQCPKRTVGFTLPEAEETMDEKPFIQYRKPNKLFGKVILSIFK